MTEARGHLLVLALYIAVFACWFSPALIRGEYLAPGDGLISYVPDYVSQRTLWEPALGTGYPAAADPQTFTWYLPEALLSWIPGSYDAFAISGYVLAAWFTYLLGFTLTGSRLAGWIAGILYGCSGFPMAHLGHPSIVHSAAWIPAVLLGLERIRGAHSGKWFAFGCFATSQLVVSGHPQIVWYGLLLATAYAAVRGYSTSGVRTYYVRAVLLLGFGIGLSSVMLVPLLEISRLSIRHNVTFEFFNYARFPLRSFALLFFPYLYGGEWGSIYGERFYVDITESDEFLGFLTLALATFAFVRRKQTAPVYFLSGAALLALVCSFGGDTIVGRILFHVVPFNLFGCQGRFLVIFQLAMALLAGIGVKAILSGIPAKRAAVQLGILVVLEIAAALTVSMAQGPWLRQVAAARGVPNVSFALTQPTFLVPLACSAVAALAILLLLRSPARTVSAVVLSLAALADMGQFGLFGNWRYYSPSRDALDPPSTAALVRSLTGRVVAVRGYLGNKSELPPNSSKLWGVQSLNKYGPLAVERYDLLTGMDASGTLAGPWWKTANRALDVLGAHYVLAPDADIGEMDRFEGIPMPAEDLDEDLGERAGRRLGTEISFAVDNNKRFTSLALVSFLRDSVDIGPGTPVFEIRLRAESGRDAVIPGLAGRDTAEFLADCTAVRNAMEHKAATIFKKVVAEENGATCQGNLYFAHWPLARSEHWSSLDVKWLGSQGGMQIVKLVLWNEETGAIQAISHMDVLGRFRLVARQQSARVYENGRAMPRVWLVSQALSLNAEAVKWAIHTSILPDGSTFNPSTTALVEEAVDLKQQAPDPGASAFVTRAENTVVEARTQSRERGLLVLADLYYPGWTATVNGRAARILRTNFVERGVEVPAGDNVVRFTFRPWSLYLGIAISLASLAGIALTCAMDRRARPLSPVPHQAAM